MRIIFTLAAALAFSLSAFAQAPGFMGKKHQFTYTPSIAMYGNESRAQQNALGFFYLNHHIEYDYVIQKRRSIGLLYEYAGYDLSIGYYNWDNRSNEIFARYTRQQIGFSYKKYSKHSIAPLGFYWKFTLSMAYKKAYIVDEILNPSLSNFPTTYSGWEPIVGVGLGREIILWKYVPMNFGFDVNLALLSMKSGGYAEDIEDAARRTTLGSTLFRFNVGIGLLAF